MGELLRRYWHPIAAASEFVDKATKPIRLLGEKMCISVVPEGIETEAQLTYLKELGFEHAQGFLFGRPRPPESHGGPAS